MNETKVKAIVLGGIDYKEKDMLVNLFTLESGIVSVVFRGVKSPNAKLKSAKELFSFGDFIYSDAKNHVVTSAEIIDSFYNITKNLKKYYTACAMVDAVKTALPQNEANPKVFLSLLKCLKLLSDGEASNHNVLNKFLITLLQEVGYSFSLDECNNCGEPFMGSRYINLKYGDITCKNCRNDDCVELSPATCNVLRLYCKTDFEKLPTLKIPEQNNEKTLKLLLLNFKYRFNKSLTVLM